MIPVVLESPYAGHVTRNRRYLAAALRDCLMRNEAPYASHGLYTAPGVLDDTIPAERELGIAAGFLWGDHARVTVVYADLGITPGMKRGIERAANLGRKIELRRLPAWINGEPAPTRPMAVTPSALLAGANTLSIELSLARNRHRRLLDLWTVVGDEERLKLAERIFT